MLNLFHSSNFYNQNCCCNHVSDSCDLVACFPSLDTFLFGSIHDVSIEGLYFYNILDTDVNRWILNGYGNRPGIRIYLMTHVWELRNLTSVASSHWIGWPTSQRLCKYKESRSSLAIDGCARTKRVPKIGWEFLLPDDDDLCARIFLVQEIHLSHRFVSPKRFSIHPSQQNIGIVLQSYFCFPSIFPTTTYIRN